MYTRSYDDNLGIVIPESYSGTAFKDTPKEAAEASVNEAVKDEKKQTNPWEKDNVHSENEEKYAQTGSFISKLPFKGFFSDIFKNTNFGLQKIGSEEILIIATAAFLFFSKDGDKECALMLLLLLFLS